MRKSSDEAQHAGDAQRRDSDIMCANKTAIRYITSFLRNAQAGPASSICVRSKTREHLIEQVRCFFVCSVFSEPDEHGVLRALKRQKKKKTGLNQTAKQLFGCKQTLGISVLILQAGEKMYQVEVQVKTLTVPEWLEKYCQPEKFVPLCRECPQYGKNWSWSAGNDNGGGACRRLSVCAGDRTEGKIR